MPTFGLAFGVSAALAAILLVAVTLFVLRPEIPQRIRLALRGESRPAAVEPGVQPSVEPALATTVPRTPPVAPPALMAETVTIPRIEMVPSDPDAELIRRVARAAADGAPLDARPVGGVHVREYELSDGQRVMVVDQVRSKPVQPVMNYY